MKAKLAERSSRPEANAATSEADLKGRLLELLYGLLDDEEAEALRREIATDANAARLFDEARETVALLTEAAREDVDEPADVVPTSNRVVVDRRAFDSGAAFAFDAASGRVVDGKTAENESNVAAPLGESLKEPTTETSKKSLKKEKTAKKPRRSFFAKGKKGKEADLLGAKGAWATVGRTSTPDGKSGGASERSNVGGNAGNSAVDADAAANPVFDPWGAVATRRVERAEKNRRSRPFGRGFRFSLFVKLNLLLAFLCAATLIGFATQEHRLNKRLRDVFRVRIAAPPTLARGVSQSISSTTTAPNGKPRRVPVRFRFVDPSDGRLLAAHTESGDAGGVARFDLPDVSDFPDKTLLTISAGEPGRETKTIETTLTVVDAPSANGGATAGSRPYLPKSVRASSAQAVADFASAPSPVGRNDVMGGGDDGGATDDVMGGALSIKPAPKRSSTGGVMGGGLDMGGDEADLFLSVDGARTPKAPKAPRRGKGEKRKRETAAVGSFAYASNSGIDLLEASEAEDSEDAVVDADSEETRKAFDEPTFARFFPEGGRLVAGVENRVWVECVDAEGAPVAERFELKDDAGTVVATVETNENGVGATTIRPEENAVYRLFGGERDVRNADAEETNEPKITVETVETSGPVAAVEDEAPEASIESSETPKSCGAALPSAVPATARLTDVAVVVAPGEPIRFAIEMKARASFVATVEKDGILTAQRVLTANRGKLRVAIPLAPGVDGALRLALYRDGDSGNWEKIGEAALYREGDSTVPPFAVDATLGADSTLRIRVDRAAKATSGSAPGADAKADFGANPTNDAPFRFDAFWAPNVAAGVRALGDDALGALDDGTKEAIFRTRAPSSGPTPIVFDNLDETKARTFEALKDFADGAFDASFVARLGVFGCVALAFAAALLVAFRALRVWRGAVLALGCAVLATVFFFEQRTFDNFAAVSAKTPDSTAKDDDSATRPASFDDSAFGEDAGLKTVLTDDAGAKTVRAVATGSAILGTTTAAPLERTLFDAEDGRGVLFVRVADEDGFVWRVLGVPKESSAPSADANESEPSAE